MMANPEAISGGYSYRASRNIHRLADRYWSYHLFPMGGSPGPVSSVVPGAGGRSPDFLVIGAMKAGTTTLWHDLRKSPEIYLPHDKEPGNLRYDNVLTGVGLRAYKALFDSSRDDQICGEASTFYSMLPEFPGVPDRARRVCRPDLKVIYLIRNPLQRIISHHKHAALDKDMPLNINTALRVDRRLLDYSKYAMQIAPWIDAFGRTNVYLLPFENYVRYRADALKRIGEFLGVALDSANSDTRAYNTSESLRRLPSGIKKISSSKFYKSWLRPYLPYTARASMQKLLGSGLPPGYSSSLTNDSLRQIVDAVGDDTRQIAKILGASEPLWDIAQLPSP